jgi:hypothetical protein
VIEGLPLGDAAPRLADHHGQFGFIIERNRFAGPADRLLMRDQTRREAGEDFRISRLLQPAFLQVIIVVEPDARNFRRYGDRRQQPDSLQVDCRRLPEATSYAQQVCALRDQLGKCAWKSAVPLGEAVPPRAFIRGNSWDSTRFKMDDTHKGDPLARLRATQFLEQENERLIRPPGRVPKAHLTGSVRREVGVAGPINQHQSNLPRRRNDQLGMQ